MTTKHRTVDALEIIDDRYFKGRPEMETLLQEAEERLRLAERLREMREKQALSQEEVANRVGTTRSVIARLEKPGYQKHTLTTLKKVAGALGYEVKVEFVPIAHAASNGKAVAKEAQTGNPLTKSASKRVPKKTKAKV